MKKNKHATTKNLKKGIRQMEKESLSLGARVEIYLKDDPRRFGIVGISHYHAIPNLVLKIEEIKDNLAK